MSSLKYQSLPSHLRYVDKYEDGDAPEAGGSDDEAPSSKKRFIPLGWAVSLGVSIVLNILFGVYILLYSNSSGIAASRLEWTGLNYCELSSLFSQKKTCLIYG